MQVDQGRGGKIGCVEELLRPDHGRQFQKREVVDEHSDLACHGRSRARRRGPDMYRRDPGNLIQTVGLDIPTSSAAPQEVAGQPIAADLVLASTTGLSRS